MSCIETIATAWGEDGRFEAVLEILPDDDPPLPPDAFGCNAVFVRTYNARDLAKELAAAFGQTDFSWDGTTERARRIAARLAAGEVVKDDDGTWYDGVAEYRHGGSAFALCCSQQHRNFPDQRWDVIGLCGWSKITRQNRIDWGIHGRKGVEASARMSAEGALEAWEEYLNGWFAVYKVALREAGALGTPAGASRASKTPRRPRGALSWTGSAGTPVSPAPPDRDHQPNRGARTGQGACPRG